MPLVFDHANFEFWAMKRKNPGRSLEVQSHNFLLPARIPDHPVSCPTMFTSPIFMVLATTATLACIAPTTTNALEHVHDRDNRARRAKESNVGQVVGTSSKPAKATKTSSKSAKATKTPKAPKAATTGAPPLNAKDNGTCLLLAAAGCCNHCILPNHQLQQTSIATPAPPPAVRSGPLAAQPSPHAAAAAATRLPRAAPRLRTALPPTRGRATQTV